MRQFGSFVLVGCVNTAVYLGVYASLNRWIPYLAAHVLGYAVSIVCSFLLNSYVTCRTKPTWRGFVRYPVSSLANLVASGALLYGAVSGLGMDKNLAALAAGIIVTPLSFLLARWAIMSGRRAQATEASEATDATGAAGAAGAAETPEVSVPERPARPLPGRAAADRSFAPRTTTHPTPQPSVRSSEDR
ncbi:GtrA family protein [Streptomyces microflavus]